MTENKSLSAQLHGLGIEPVTYRAMQDLHPGANSNSLMMMLRYCQAAKLDPLRSPVVILPIDGKQVPVLSINGLRAHAVRTGRYAGSRVEFADTVDEILGVNLPTWCRCIVSRERPDGSLAEFEGQVWATEVVGRKKDGSVTAIWRKRSMHMFQIAAERLALRRAFPESVPPDDIAPATNQINPETGEILGQAPRHLSDEDIAAGLDNVESTDSDADWLDQYERA